MRPSVKVDVSAPIIMPIIGQSPIIRIMPIMPGPVIVPGPMGMSRMPMPDCCARKGAPKASSPAATSAIIARFVRFMIDTPLSVSRLVHGATLVRRFRRR